MDYGFCGIFARHDDPGAALTLASKAVVKATGCSDEDIRTFLESIQGRYFAEGVSKLLSENALSTAAAVDVVVARWMHLKILTGFVCHCELKGGHGQRLAAPYQLFCVEESSGSQFSINSSACWDVGRPSCEAGRYPLCESWRLAISTRGNMRHR